jgi:MFS transporter, ACS family, glucarate transporter
MNPLTRPTRVRYSMLGLLCMLAMITYLDRAMYGSAKDDMMKAVGRDPADFFWVLVAFQLAYACFEIPTGWMGDTFGPRKTLLRIVVWWSFFVALTAFAGLTLPGSEIIVIGFVVLIAMQFLFGMGEAGAFPNMARAIYNWFPANQRGFAQGSIWLAARFLGGLTPFIWVLLVEMGGLSWRQALWLFAGLAAAWCVVFSLWFRNHPSEHPSTNQAERDLIESGRYPQAGHHGVPWKKIFTNRNVLALCAMYMVTNFNWYFLMYYLPKALKGQFSDWNDTDGGKLKLALMAGAPLLIGMVGCMLGGILTDRYIRRTNDRKWGRRIFAMFGYGMAGVCYLTATAFTNNIWIFASCLMLVGFFNDFIMGPSWAAAQDIGRSYSATVSGTMNMVGNLGATLGNLVTGLILKSYTHDGEVQSQGYVVLFTLYGCLYLVGVVLWLWIDASRPILAEET